MGHPAATPTKSQRLFRALPPGVLRSSSVGLTAWDMGGVAAFFPARSQHSGTRQPPPVDQARRIGHHIYRCEALYGKVGRGRHPERDDWMRDAITIQNAQDMWEVLDDRFGHTATLIVSQVPIAAWHHRIPDPTLADAILDRLVHNAHRIELKGESQRKIRAKRTMSNT